MELPAGGRLPEIFDLSFSSIRLLKIKMFDHSPLAVNELENQALS
jgi:hypothetical protein